MEITTSKATSKRKKLKNKNVKTDTEKGEDLHHNME